MPRKDRAFGEWYSKRAKGGSKRRKQKIGAHRKSTGGSRYATKRARRES